MNRLVMVDAMETSTTFCLNMTVGEDVEVIFGNALVVIDHNLLV